MTDSPRRAAPRSLLAFLVFAATTVQAADEPLDWLLRMADAVERLNYQGTMVHMHSGQADILRIVHRFKNGQVSERITTVDGPSREIIRSDDEVTCILPDQNAVVVEPREAHSVSQSPLQGRLPRLDELDQRYYELAFVDDALVAGRGTRVLEVRPMDGFRFGYRLALDAQTALPLKSQLIDVRGQTIEEIMFTTVELAETIAERELEPSLSTANLQIQRSEDATDAAVDGTLRSGWQVARLPEGFMLIAARAKLAPGAPGPMEQLVYSDGLASVSLFVEMKMEQDADAEGLSGMGATNAYTTVVDAYLVTAVGEVPARTVEMMAMSATPRAVAGR